MRLICQMGALIEISFSYNNEEREGKDIPSDEVPLHLHATIHQEFMVMLPVRHISAVSSCAL